MSTPELVYVVEMEVCYKDPSDVLNPDTEFCQLGLHRFPRALHDRLRQYMGRPAVHLLDVLQAGVDEDRLLPPPYEPKVEVVGVPLGRVPAEEGVVTSYDAPPIFKRIYRVIHDRILSRSLAWPRRALMT